MRHEYNEDLFEGTKMTFGEHLEELRTALFKSLLALAAFFVVGLVLGQPVVRMCADPLRAELKAHFAKQGNGQQTDELHHHSIRCRASHHPPMMKARSTPVNRKPELSLFRQNNPALRSTADYAGTSTADTTDRKRIEQKETKERESLTGCTGYESGRALHGPGRCERPT